MDRRSSRSRLATLAVLSFLATASSSWAETADEAVKRLDACLFYAKELGRGGDTLVVDLDDTVAKIGRTDALARLQADACVWRGETLLAGRDEKLEARAITYLERVADTPTYAAEFVRRAVGALVEVHVRRGERFEATDARAALEEYENAIVRDADDPRPYKSIGGLTARTAEADEAAQKYDEALESVNRNRPRIVAKLGDSDESVKLLDAVSKRILATTAVLDLRWLGALADLRKVKGKVTEFVGGELRFTPGSSGKTPLPVALEPGSTRRLPRGEFAATAVAKDGGTYPLPVDLRGERGTITLPSALPEGMVLVTGTAEIPAFLIDRTEVRKSVFAPFANANGVKYYRGDADDSLPARGMTYEDAKRFAEEAMGKRLPTEAQWKRAALGTPDGSTRKYPWAGDTFEAGTHFVGMNVSSEPLAVTQCPKGASAFGAINMVGNVMEWIEPGWALGGAYSMPGMTAELIANGDQLTIGWQIRFLEDPIPSGRCVDDRVLPAGRDRSYYSDAIQLRNETHRMKVGLRCVVPLGIPREKP